MTVLPADAELRQVALGDDGLAQGASSKNVLLGNFHLRRRQWNAGSGCKSTGGYNEARGEVLAETGEANPSAAIERLSSADRTVLESSIQGDRKMLVADAFIPLTMAFIFLGLLLYFRAIGGYKAVHIVPREKQADEAA